MTATASYSISIDRGHNLIDVRISGMLMPEDVQWIGEDIRGAVRSLGDGAARHVTLYDLTALHVAPAASVEMIKNTFSNPVVRAQWSRKLAVVATTALLRLQARRVQEARPDLRMFDTREVALAWLLAE